MLYFMVTLKIKPGKIQEYLKQQQTHLPVLFEKFGIRLIGSWLTTVGEANEVVAIHGYRDFEHLQGFWNQQAQDPELQEYTRTVSEYLDGANTRIMAPTPYSPIK
ncbi:MAG: NIPSNAP family protein [Candidatus Tectomicrobia bacterium]|uniref:NIPSNAP family protein n=1 Tax=Tectimicrobiota bacterium TaxID=2528274 RepID=A0A933GQ06_UNCTE|nr:NIPSNAP family protein [Candidatus Tectomicrobia bacterium]